MGPGWCGWVGANKVLCYHWHRSTLRCPSVIPDNISLFISSFYLSLHEQNDDTLVLAKLHHSQLPHAVSFLSRQQALRCRRHHYCFSLSLASYVHSLSLCVCFDVDLFSHTWLGEPLSMSAMSCSVAPHHSSNQCMSSLLRILLFRFFELCFEFVLGFLFLKSDVLMSQTGLHSMFVSVWR